MDLEYDHKFEEMKKYIPFLESMIKRLESSSSGLENPRQAQLDKIRSLRDLLLDKKKRMKMENLLKCEQVLINLYAKVEQKDSVPGINNTDDVVPCKQDSQKDKTDLEVVRNKLKCVAAKTAHETLPEIARANEVDERCSSKSKEPALFQRRPNKSSKSPPSSSSVRSDKSQSSKRNYTRVLLSPDHSPRPWTAENKPTDKPLFSRRSPWRKSPRRYSPSYHKRERKKSSKQESQSRRYKNITLNVPEESLNSLNTKDIVSRIMNCNDDDVDVVTLQKLKTELKNELSQIGAIDETDLILWKENHKERKSKTKNINKNKSEEVEEGELSDSESEAIENVYGSLVIMEKDKETTPKLVQSLDKDKQARKVQICVVIKSNKDNSSADGNIENIGQEPPKIVDITDFEMFDNHEKNKEVVSKDNLVADKEQNMVSDTIQNRDENVTNKSNAPDDKEKHQSEISIDDKKEITSDLKENSFVINEILNKHQQKHENADDLVAYKANFYKPLLQQDDSSLNTQNNNLDVNDVALDKLDLNKNISSSKSTSTQHLEKLDTLQDTKKTTEIPFLNLVPTAQDQPVQNREVSEIDILQALKNEILSETIAIPGAETVTPALHQPKIMKVASAQESMSKKRITIEKYKEKSVTKALFVKGPNTTFKEDPSKKPSLKLTEKECERFNFPSKLSLDESSEEEDKDKPNMSLDDIYNDLAPKSPDHDIGVTSESIPPVIIPVDPVKSTIASSKADIDMRQLAPLLSPNTNSFMQTNNKTISTDSVAVTPELETKIEQNKHSYDKSRATLIDPRIRRDINQSIKDSPNHLLINAERTPMRTPTLTYPNMTPNARSYEMTPSRQSFELDDQPNKKHVYAPVFPVFEPCEHREKSVSREGQTSWEGSETSTDDRRTHWESSDSRDKNYTRKWGDRDPRSNSVLRDDSLNFEKYHQRSIERQNCDKRDDNSFNRSDCPSTPSHYFGKSDCPPTPSHPFGRLEMPMTPVHPFGRLECPPTPSHSFGRLECPTTPSHPFGRIDCPPTPSQSFGRNEYPPTPSHPFGRSECPTPSHPFGRSECPTPSHPFGRSECAPNQSAPFGRSECPLTPSHPFGISEMPMTPSHPFGRSEMHITPNHPFGRSEMPMTPNHPFGRSEIPMTPNHPFGRSDYSQNNSMTGPKYGKSQDPRLKRSSDCQNYNDDRERGHYRDNSILKFNRGVSHNSERNRSYNTDSYQTYGREINVGNNDKNKSYNYGHSSRNFTNEQTPRRELSVGRSINRDYDGERSYTRNRDFSSDYSDETFKRERSVGRATSSRSSSVGRHYIGETTNENTLSVQSHAGRSFTIDTSVNRTFQELISTENKNLNNFDIRRQRAVSVGRSLTRESSVGRSLFYDNKLINNDNESRNTNNNFRRARSVGRDFGQSAEKSERSFRDIKADLESFKTKSDKEQQVKTQPRGSISTRNYRSHRSRKGIYEKHETRYSDEKLKYLPKKICRDPRMRREQQYDNKNRKNFDDKNRTCSRDRNNYGIVYSNDNIARGAILGSGYGVKNYKIPKIKRLVEEKEENLVKEKTVVPDKEKTMKSKTRIEENKTCEINIAVSRDKQCQDNSGPSKNNSSSNHNKSEKIVEKDDKLTPNTDMPGKRMTRSGRRYELDLQLSDDETVVRTKRNNRPVINDSDSEDDFEEKYISNEIISFNEGKLDSTKNNNSNVISEKKIEISKQLKTIENSEKKDELLLDLENKNKEKEVASSLDTSFGIDDLEVFSDNIVSDPVIHNINDLIADLDNDLDSSTKTEKQNQFDKELTAKDKVQKISPIPNNKKELQEHQNVNNPRDNSENVHHLPKEHITTDNNSEINEQLIVQLQASEVIETMTNNTKIGTDSPNSKQFHKEKSDNLKNNNPDELLGVNKTSKEEKSTLIHLSESTESETKNENEVNNEPMVSTTKSDMKLDNKDIDISSTPDSTINSDEGTGETSLDREMPDSTNVEQSEMNSDITSTQDQSANKVFSEPTAIPKESPSEITSLGKLISILQDKSKIKELLNMLGNKNSENEKLKKKLEKLSEIVSDDEDEKDVQHEDNTVNVDKGDSIELQNKIREETLNSKIETDPKNNVTTNEKNEINSKEEEIEANLKTPEEKQSEKFGALGKTNQIPLSKMKKIPNKISVRKGIKKGKGKNVKSVISNKEKRTTRSEAASLQKDKPASRELKQLQDDIKEMFLSDDILNDTGIRMCRLAKLVDDKSLPKNQKDEKQVREGEPFIVLEQFKDLKVFNETPGSGKSLKRKPGPKSKIRISTDQNSVDDKKSQLTKTPKQKPGPKSKTRIERLYDTDPYAFESDSISETNTAKASENSIQNSSDSESDSAESSKSIGCTEQLAELKKKPKRQRRGWQSGVIKSKNRKKKRVIQKAVDNSNSPSYSPVPQKPVTIPDTNCFTDKNYCFLKNVSNYPCRLCDYNGNDIVHHYKKHHPHFEIPISRMHPAAAKEAIEQCKEVNFQRLSKMSTERYVCRFCFKEFPKSKAILETFFWHIVSTHTGEYKQLCSECINETRCLFNLDIPPPPKDIKGQLIGYICGKCHFTQISLENLKTHVIVHHNDEQTEVYTINLALMSKKTISYLIKRSLRNANLTEQPRVLRSSRSNQSVNETSDDRSDDVESTKLFTEIDARRREPVKDPSETKNEAIKQKSIKSIISFETEDSFSATSVGNIDENIHDTIVKIKQEEKEDATKFDDAINDIPKIPDTCDSDKASESDVVDQSTTCSDIVVCMHFKIQYTDTGIKEYVCCVNGNDNHYKTNLLISMKKHVQTKHSEKWDGYCFLCKLIVTPLGGQSFKDCLQHYVDRHMDDFPVLERVTTTQLLNKTVSKVSDTPDDDKALSPKPYINVRPLSELISKPDDVQEDNSTTLPKIKSVISLGAVVEPPRPSPTYPSPKKDIEPPREYKYEEAQAEIMSKKHRVVLETMMSPTKLVQVFKCAGRFCSFSCDSAEDALLHASTHQRVGGQDALNCAYCDFDSSGNAIDLVSHVFKLHGHCQFVCGQCFYRAVASQLVKAHFIRVHKKPLTMLSVLRTSVVTSNVKATEMLTREAAVPYYVCGTEDGCKFRIHILPKFVEHIQKHPLNSTHTCYICSRVLSKSELIEHFKSHGLKLYQCTWCIHGAEDEAELLAHASANHPFQQPQAYARIIATKEGSSQIRVLPLAQLNKSDVLVEDVKPNANHENPVREAERSLELEKLIKHTMFLIESAQLNNTESQLEASSIIESRTSNCSPSVTVTQNPTETTPTQDQNFSQQVTPVVLKTEQLEQTPTKSDINSDVVYCLSSDEEDSKQVVINLSDEDSRATSQEVVHPTTADTTTVEPANDTDANTRMILPPRELYKCYHCQISLRLPSTFKKHLLSCIPSNDTEIKCLYCSFKTSASGQVKIDQLIDHIGSDHTRISTYICAICKEQNTYLIEIKKHLKKVHGITDIIVVSSTNQQHYVVQEMRGENQLPKRKRSVGSTPVTPTPVTPLKKYYSPQEIDQLPINPILDESVFCSKCGFNTKVRLNMVRHLQFHAQQQPVPETTPVNPVPHLETNEKHFDKMVNLASSSIVNRVPDKTTRGDNPNVTSLIPPEAASRYPKYVPERQRLTCGAKDCLYISVDEAMLKRHWETLHTGTNDYHCVHCPPYQHLDTSKPLTASRIIAHLKMHDVRLYACSVCSYYHHKLQVVEKHVSEFHKTGHVMTVREDLSASTSAMQSQSLAPAPTMDLKPWQCGLCKYKSMLRPEVVEHCYKLHSSKMQYKCAYCPFRTSTLENVTKHQSLSHVGKTADICYLYYREGSIPDESDGTPRWVFQRQRSGISEPEVKTETEETHTTTNEVMPPKPATPIETATMSTQVDLNLVKQEVENPSSECEETIEDLCKEFGQFCEPSGIRYKCSLCNVVFEDTREAMQSHLYEELQYRKWGCSICYYKAFHKKGFEEHMFIEHRQNQGPIELPINARVETWVTKSLDHQMAIIEKKLENLAKQKIQVDRISATPSTPKPQEKAADSNVENRKYTMTELEKAFGQLGTPSNMQIRCPKCNLTTKEEGVMQDHLESELTRIRWCCSHCTDNFQTYHEVQFHCKSVHTGQAARPVEAVRDPAMRSAWVAAVIRVQKLSMNYIPVNFETTLKDTPTTSDKNIEQPDTAENSLLVARYAERVPTPETQSFNRKRSVPLSPNSGNEDVLVIDESPSTSQVAKKKTRTSNFSGQCPYCYFSTKAPTKLNHHILKHYDLKPYKCEYCPFSSFYKSSVASHCKSIHFDKPSSVLKVEIPDTPPTLYVETLVCTTCEKLFTEIESKNHVHENINTEFAKKGDILVKCSICLIVVKDVIAMRKHHSTFHPKAIMNYSFYKLLSDKRDIFICGCCDKRFTSEVDLKAHHNIVHMGLQLNYTSVPYTPGYTNEFIVNNEIEVSNKRKLDTDDTVLPSPKKVARKSTTKLPMVNAVAKKSTTKLPISVIDSDIYSETEKEYSFYGTKPTPMEDLRNVTTYVTFCNAKLPYTIQQLSNSTNINPKVLLEDITISNRYSDNS